MGLERFNLDIGILSRIQNDNYTVEYCVVPEGLAIAPDDSYDFDLTYCKITCNARGPVMLEHIGMHDEYASHPAYRELGLEAYVGIPVRLNGEVYGTLNFSSAAPYPRKFKDIDIDALQLMASWIGVELERREQAAQLQALTAQLEELATIDGLTKIPNRRGMLAQLRKEMNRLMRNNGRATLARIDIDDFEKLNNSHGHMVGNAALVSIAETIGDSIRDYDYLARYGENEFFLILPDTSLILSSKVFSRIMANVAAQSTEHLQLSVSIGSYPLDFDDDDINAIDQLLDEALARSEEALQAAKSSGGSQHSIYGQTASAA